jgi:hypothetical protein
MPTTTGLDRQGLIAWYHRNRARSAALFDLVSDEAYYSRRFRFGILIFYEDTCPGSVQYARETRPRPAEHRCRLETRSPAGSIRTKRQPPRPVRPSRAVRRRRADRSANASAAVGTDRSAEAAARRAFSERMAIARPVRRFASEADRQVIGPPSAPISAT